MGKLLSKESVLEVAKGFTFTDKTQEKQYMDFLVYCLNNAKDNSKPLTNADKIRSMTDEELAEFLLKVNKAYAEPCMTRQSDCKWEDYPTHNKGCKDCFLEWLKSEVEEK